jgi:hypothetical protein
LNNFLEKKFSPLVHQKKIEGILIVDCLQNKMKKKYLQANMESTIYLDEQDKKESKKQGSVLQSQIMGLTVRNSLEDNFLKEI